MAKTRKSSAPVVKTSPMGESQPSREAIALRAYEIYLERGGEPGHELEDWTRAELELSAKNGRPRRRVSPKSVAA